MNQDIKRGNLSGVNQTHVKVLLRKDTLTLKRNVGFLATFIFLPIIMMAGFSKLQLMVEGQLTPEQHNTFYTKQSMRSPHTTGWEPFMMSNISMRPANTKDGDFNITMFYGCKLLERKAIGIIMPEEMRKNILPQFEKYFARFKLKMHGFETEEDFVYDLKNDAKKDYCMAVEFSEILPGAKEVNITYMFPKDIASDTYEPLYDLQSRVPNFRSWNYTMWFGTPHLMLHATDMVIGLMTGKRPLDIQLAMVPMKTPAFKELEPFVHDQLALLFPFFYMCIFLLPLYYMITKLAEEKESKAREGMKMMGLNDKTYLMAWFIFMIGLVSLVSVMSVISSKFVVFRHSNLILILAMSILYGMNLFGFSFIIVSFMPTKKSAATAATLLHILTFFLAFVHRGNQVDNQTKMALSLFPNCALSFTVSHLFYSEHQGAGLTFSQAHVPYKNFSFVQGLMMLFIDIFIWAALGYYCDQVAPRDIGLSRSIFFPCQRFQKKHIDEKKKQSAVLGEEEHNKELVEQKNFEAVPASLQRMESMKVRGLKKTFESRGGSTAKVAVDNTSMTMYSGQIFALLGHNGAGKTTTISMLTGLLKPSGGQANVFGLDMFENMDEVRQMLGVCPQHNVLFDSLTVREHLELYAAFKGLTEDKVKANVQKMIREIELYEEANQLACTLSGGQKRKLSVGIALIGDSKLVLLDEPTSGMDTTTRRRFWEMLKNYKKDRIIILTTHYMDEADILGDRICIMAEGEIQCCGSSLYLKNRFGVGYQLTIAKQEPVLAPQIDAYITKAIPEAIKMQEVSTEMTFQIPEKASHMFKSFFKDLDQNIDNLGINSYGVGITTLEEVFLHIGHGQRQELKMKQLKEHAKHTSKDEQILNEYSIANDNERSFWPQVAAIARKKVLVMVRDRRSFLMDTIFPSMLMAIALYLNTFEVLGDGAPIRKLHPEGFPQQQPLIFNENNFNQTDGEVTEFIDMAFGNEMGTLWKEKRPIKSNYTDTFLNQIKEVDNEIFAARHTDGPQYGQFFVQNSNTEDQLYSIGILANASSQAAVTSYTAYALQGVARVKMENPEFKLNFFEKPLPISLKINQMIGGVTQCLVTCILFAVAYLMISDALIQSIIKERSTNLKHMLIVSGTSLKAYWFGNYIVDVATHLLPGVVALQCIDNLGVDAPESWNFFLWFALCNPLFVYALSHLFYTDGTASILIRISYFVLGGLGPIAIQVLQVINKRCQEISFKLEQWFVLMPIFNFNYGYLSIVNRKLFAMMFRGKISKNFKDPLDYRVAGRSLQLLYDQAFYSLCVLVIFELGLIAIFRRSLLKPIRNYCHKVIHSIFCPNKKQVKATKTGINAVDTEAVLNIVDTNPEEEAQRVDKMNAKDLQVKVHHLSKSYDIHKKAVSDLTFGLSPGECFALLGVTGAGKTTTFKCITGEEIPDQGSLHIGGHNVLSFFGQNSVNTLIGYCPQFDTIFDGVTVREHLEIYAVIKGVRGDIREQIVAKQITDMDLNDFANVHANNLSGGNKRKLQCAIALIGNPPIVLLDEPSTGVDPQAKRFMWTIISNISTQRKQSTVVLTTHSMEEAEALCPKIGIMVNGKFRCFGSAQHLKSKYGVGYELEVKIKECDAKTIDDMKVKGKINGRMELVRKSVEKVLTELGMAHQIDYIQPEGFGAEIHAQLEMFDKKGKVPVGELLKWSYIQTQGDALIAELKKNFSKVTIVEHYDCSYTLKLSKDDYSIGYLFGLMEEIKEQFMISEYSVAQTSLEQIFNVFAREDVLRKQLANDAEALQEKKLQ